MVAGNLDDQPTASAANDSTEKSSTGEKVQSSNKKLQIGLNLCRILASFVICVSDFACLPKTDGSVGCEHGATLASQDQLEEPAFKKQRTEGY